MKKLLLFALVMVLTLTVAFAQTWETVKEGKLGYGPYDGPNAGYFVDATTGWLVGDEGRVQKTTDGGMTWTTIREPDGGEDWVDVEFADANTGYACAGDGFIFKTTDGGANWDMIGDTANYVADLEGLSVVTTDLVFFCGDDSTLLKTDDGGANYTRSSNNFEGVDLDGGIAFMDANVGVVISDGNNGMTWYTHDSGDTWNFVSVAPLFPPGTISSRIYGIDAGPDSTIVITGYHYVTVVSTDGGQTYTRVGGLSYGYDRNELVEIIDANTFLVAGDYLAMTTDQGATFDTLETGSAQSYEVLCFVDANTGYVFQNYGQWMKTTDAAASWTPLLEWPIISFWGLALPEDDKIVLTAYAGGEMTVSEDGGASWTYPNNSATGAPDDLYECEFIDANNGIIAGSDAFLAKTTDGGASWTSIETPMADVNFGTFNAVHYYDADTVFAGGKKGHIYRSDDGGATWTEIPNEGSGTVYDIWPLASDHVIATLSSGVVCELKPGETSFIECFDYGYMSMRAVEYRNGIGLIAASSGHMYRTSETKLDTIYEVFTEPDGDDFYDVEFVNDTLVFAVGEAGKIYRSDDAGLTWTQETSPTEETLQKVRYRNGKVWAVGQAGMVLMLNLIPEPDLMTIAEAKVDADEDGVLDLLDQEVKIQGVVTSPNYGYNTQYYLQDETAGIVLYSGSVAADLNIGDEIEIIGTLAQYHGLSEIEIDAAADVTVLSAGNTVEPAVVTIPELGEDYEAMLVKLEGVQLVDAGSWPSEGSNGSVDFTNGLDTNYIYIDKESDLDGWTPPDDWMNLVALCDQYDEYSLRGTVQEDFMEMSMSLPVTDEVADGTFDLEWDFNDWSGGVDLFTADSTGSAWGSHVGVFVDSAYTGLAHVKNLILEDFTVSADLWIIGPADPDAPLYAGLGIKMLHHDFAYYRLVYRNSSSSDNGQIKLQGYDGANWHISQSWDPGTDFTALETGWHNFKVTVENGEFTVYVDDEKLPGGPFVDEDPFLVAGYPGIYKYNTGVGTILFDNFTVTTPEYVGVDEANEEVLPTVYRLQQNYPNPFNPTTTIAFDLPKASDVQLVIYNMLGQEVTTLCDRQMQAGRYQFTFDASQLSSGIYFYRIQADGFSDLKKMTLLK